MNKCFDGIIEDLETWNEYTGHDQWNAVYTIQLGELINCGVFDWNYSLLNWKNAAYDDEQYRRVCDYFIERFYYREISIEPFDEWARMLRSRLVFELMPRYRIQYDEAKREWDIATAGKSWGNDEENTTTTGKENNETTGKENNETTGKENTSANSTINENKDDYYKGRDISSQYPETLLSGNSDYISDGKDSENQRQIENKRTENGTGVKTLNGTGVKTLNGTGVKTTSGNEKTNAKFEKFAHLNTADYTEAVTLYSDLFGGIDKRLLDELETFFISMYTTNVNATW